MPLSDEERNVLSKVISDALGGRISMSLGDVLKIISAAKKVGIEREHVIQGLQQWFMEDPQALELLSKSVELLKAKQPKTFETLKAIFSAL